MKSFDSRPIENSERVTGTELTWPADCVVVH